MLRSLRNNVGQVIESQAWCAVAAKVIIDISVECSGFRPMGELPRCAWLSAGQLVRQRTYLSEQDSSTSST